MNDISNYCVHRVWAPLPRASDKSLKWLNCFEKLELKDGVLVYPKHGTDYSFDEGHTKQYASA